MRLESQREKLRPVHVGVVCASGIGISRLMSSRLKQEDHFTDAYFKEIQIVFVMMIPENENIDINGEILGYFITRISAIIDILL